MKTKILCLAISLFCFNNMQAAHRPGYKQVIGQFFTDYNYKGSPQYLKFAKKKTGWTVYQLDEADYAKTVSEQLFWSAQDGKYLPLNFSKADSMTTNGTADNIDAYIYAHNGEFYNFSRSAYFGYNGWSKDVIDDFGAAKNLSDTLLESLARAYGDYASCALWFQYGYHSETGFNAWYYGEPFSEGRIRFFMKYADKDLETYYRLYQQNPDYEVLVGSVFIKYSDEHMWIYSNLYLCGYGEFAQKYLPKGLFGETYKAMGRNYLKSVKENGIFFSNGDNDTYPVWYVQETEGYRRDVNVINSSLLGLPLYENTIRKGFMHQPPVKISFDSATIPIVKDYYMIYDAPSGIEATPVHISELVKAIAEGNFENKVLMKVTYGTNEMTYIVSNRFVLPVNRFNIQKDKSLSPYARQADDSILYDLGKKTYTTMDVIYLLDILDANAWQRPVYFSFTSGDVSDFMANNIVNEPLVRHLVPFNIEKEAPDLTSGILNPDLNYNILMHDMEWGKTGDKVPDLSYGRYSLSENMRTIFIDAANACLKAHDSLKAQKLLDEMMELIPVKNNPAGNSFIALASICKDFGFAEIQKQTLLKQGIDGVEKVLLPLLHDPNDYYGSALFQYLKSAKNVARTLENSDAALEIISGINVFIYKYDLGKYY